MGKYDFDIMSGFDTGFNIGSKKKTAVGAATETVLNQFNQAQDDERKLRYETKLAGAKKKAEIGAEAEAINAYGSGGPNGFMPESYKIGNTTFKNPEYANKLNAQRNQALIDKKRVTGAGGQSAAINAAMQSAKSARNARAILFPGDKPENYRATVATMKSPFLSRTTLSKDAQNLAREYGIALDLYNKSVTGTGFNQEEFQRRVEQFKTDLLSNPHAAYANLKRLEELNTDFLKVADPQGIFSEHVSPVSEFNGSGDEKEMARQEALQAIESGEYDADAIAEDFEIEFGEPL